MHHYRGEDWTKAQRCTESLKLLTHSFRRHPSMYQEANPSVSNVTIHGRKEEGVLYQIPCNNCEHLRILKVCMAEHRPAAQKCDPNNGIVVHIARTHHSIDWKASRVVKKVQGYWEWRTMALSRSRKARVPWTWIGAYIFLQSGTWYWIRLNLSPQIIIIVLAHLCSHYTWYHLII